MEPSFHDILRRIDHLSGQFQELRDGLSKAVRVAEVDPEMALTRARKVLEYILRDVYTRRYNEPPGTRPLENLQQRLVKDGHFPDKLDAYATAVRKLGNVGTHSFGEKVTAADVYQSLAQLMPVLEWYFETERPEALVPANGARPAATGAAPASAERPARKWLYMCAAAAPIVLIGLAIYGWSWLREHKLIGGPPSNGETATQASNPAPAPAEPFKGWIDLTLWDYKDPRRQGLRLNQVAALPLRTGDGLRIEAQLNRPGYMYIVWIDTEGKATPVYPWTSAQWTERPANEEPQRRLRLPDIADEWANLKEGPSGMISLLLLVRDTPLAPTEDLAKIFAGLEGQAAPPLKAAAWFENGEVATGDPDRAATLDFTTRPKSADPVLRTQALLQTKLKKLFPYTRAVCFAYQGK